MGSPLITGGLLATALLMLLPALELLAFTELFELLAERVADAELAEELLPPSSPPPQALSVSNAATSVQVTVIFLPTMPIHIATSPFNERTC